MPRGEPVTARLTLRNRMPWGVWGVSVGEGFTDRPSDEPDRRRALACAPGRRTIATTGVRPRPPRRLPDRDAAAACRVPVRAVGGVAAAGRRVALLVWPRTFPVGAGPRGGGAEDVDGLATRDRAGPGRPAGVRPYRRGDPLRRVHWARRRGTAS